MIWLKFILSHLLSDMSGGSSTLATSLLLYLKVWVPYFCDSVERGQSQQTVNELQTLVTPTGACLQFHAVFKMSTVLHVRNVYWI